MRFPAALWYASVSKLAVHSTEAPCAGAAFVVDATLRVKAVWCSGSCGSQRNFVEVRLIMSKDKTDR